MDHADFMVESAEFIDAIMLIMIVCVVILLLVVIVNNMRNNCKLMSRAFWRGWRARDKIERNNNGRLAD